LSILYGSLVLAGILGRITPEPTSGTTVLIANKTNPTAGFLPVRNQLLAFKAQNMIKPDDDVKFVPLYEVYDEYYSVYRDLFTQ